MRASSPTVPMTGTPSRRWLSAWVAYGAAVVLPALTVGARLAVAPWFGHRPMLMMFVVPIIISAYLGGGGPGLVATVLVALASNYFLMSPVGSLAISRPVDITQWSILLAVGVLVSCLRFCGVAW